MKKQFIAKLLALGMVLSMLPVVALAAADSGSRNANYGYWVGYYYTVSMDTTILGNSGQVGDPDIAFENGVATITVDVLGGVATVSLSEAAVASLADMVQDGVLVLRIDAEGATSVTLSLPGKALTELAVATGADLAVVTPVAEVTIPNEALATQFADVETVDIITEITYSGAYSVLVKADGRAVDISGLEFKTA